MVSYVRMQCNISVVINYFVVAVLCVTSYFYEEIPWGIYSTPILYNSLNYSVFCQHRIRDQLLGELITVIVLEDKLEVSTLWCEDKHLQTTVSTEDSLDTTTI